MKIELGFLRILKRMRERWVKTLLLFTATILDLVEDGVNGMK